MFFGVFSVSIYVSQHKEDIFGGMEEVEDEQEEDEQEDDEEEQYSSDSGGWHADPWSNCSAACGDGVRVR